MKLMWLSTVLALCATIPASPPPAEDVRVTIDGKSAGRTFEGIGALSAGASSRLLIDYPSEQLSDILDILFKPRFAASLHHLKVEIGGDINSTDGTEPSHARTREELVQPRPEYFGRGYEWMLMKEAKRRNPDIILDALQWGSVPWIGESDPGRNESAKRRFYSQDNAEYIVGFLRGASLFHGLNIDYCGIWNETPYDIAWIKRLRRTLDKAGLKRVKIVAADQTPDIAPEWKIAEDILADPELALAVHTIGAHYVSSTAWKHSLKDAFASTPEARHTGKPLWASEDGPWRGDWEGARWLAKIFNRNYVVGKMTKTIFWSLVTSYYDNLPIPGSGPMKANSPWSGHYQILPAIWAIAHTTQFVQPGWKYLDNSCGILRDGGSYVALRNPATDDWSLIVETMDAKQPQTMHVRVTGGLSTGSLHVRRTTAWEQFEKLPEIQLNDNSFTIDLAPDAIYSFTTTRGQQMGVPTRPVPRASDFPLPYSDDFDKYERGKTPKYFSDLFGAFEVAELPEKKGGILRQVITAPGIEWPIVPHRCPRSIIGSRKWIDYQVSCDVLPENGGWAELGARFDKPWGSGYWLRIHSDGGWQAVVADTVFAAGKVAVPASHWNHLRVICKGDLVTFTVDGADVASLSDTTFRSGLAGLGTGWNKASFDNFDVRPISH